MKKFKIYFALIVVLLWIFAAFKVYVILQEHKQNNAEEYFEQNTEKYIAKENSPVQIFFNQFLEEIYGDYYYILNVKVKEYTPEEKNPEDKNCKFYFVSLEKQLKFDSVYRIPFVSGMKQAVDDLKGNKTAARIYNKKTNELKQYIGKKQIENNVFKVIFKDIDDFETADVEITTYRTDCSAVALKPPSSAVMIKEGYKYIKSYVSANLSGIAYNNIAAIRYADKYTSNPLSKEINTGIWNKNFKSYENDCANFVSQCILAGGLAKSSVWYPDSLIWIRTGSPKTNNSGVTSYMQKNNFFYATSFCGISAGGFICLVKESHTVFVVSNDSITILFNGHTNDRKRVSFPHLSISDAIYLSPNNY